MAIMVDTDTRVLVQGITGREGTLHTQAMQRYGTKIVAGVTPGKGGLEVAGVPVYDTVSEAVGRFPEINATAIFVPARFAADAVYEAVDAGIRTLVVITEHIPVHDAMKFITYVRDRGVKLIGPNCPGIISPSMTKIGIMPGHLFARGPIGIVSRSGTLTYEIAWSLTSAGFGQSTAVGIGGDPVTGLDFTELVEMFNHDPETRAVVIVGEIGGDAEERFSQYLEHGGMRKPVVAFVAGRTAPPGKRMGHAGAIIAMGSGTAEAKRQAFLEARVPVAELPSDVPKLVAKAARLADSLVSGSA